MEEAVSPFTMEVLHGCRQSLGLAAWQAMGRACLCEESHDMIWPKGCKRCGGDLMLQWEERWSHVSCMQCGMIKVAQDQLALVSFGYRNSEEDTPKAA